MAFLGLNDELSKKQNSLHRLNKNKRLREKSHNKAIFCISCTAASRSIIDTCITHISDI